MRVKTSAKEESSELNHEQDHASTEELLQRANLSFVYFTTFSRSGRVEKTQNHTNLRLNY